MPRTPCRLRPVGRGLRRVGRLAALCLLAMTLSGCNFLLNEAFVYDVAPPPIPEPPSGVEPGW